MNNLTNTLSFIDRILKPKSDTESSALSLRSLLIFFALVIIIFSIASPSKFLSLSNLQSITTQLPTFGILSLAMGICMITGGINLSIIASANITSLFSVWIFSSYLSADANVLIVFLVLIASIIVGAIIGFIIGLLVAYLRIHSILVSLSAMLLLKGIGTALTMGKTISGVPVVIKKLTSYYFLSLPLSFYLFIIIAIVLYLILAKTPLGKYIYMIGSNQLATNYSGVDTRKVLLIVYVISSILTVLAGIIMMSKFNSASIGYGENYLLQTVLACILGGINPYGGFGKIFGIVIAIFSLQTIASGLNIIGANQYLSMAIWGAILFIIVLASKIRKQG